MRATLLLTLAMLLAGCSAPTSDDAPGPRGPFRVTSAAFAAGAPIPIQYTCDGASLSPPISVEGAPAAATALALITGDPDAPFPQAPQLNVTHWLLWNAIPDPAGNATFPEGGIPEGAREGLNQGDGQGWMGPCPPPGSPAHRYIFTLHALDAPLELAAGATRAELEAALDGHVLATTSLTGMYARAIGLP